MGCAAGMHGCLSRLMGGFLNGDSHSPNHPHRSHAFDIELWSRAKAKATLERKSMKEVLFEGLNLRLKQTESDKKPKKSKKTK